MNSLHKIIQNQGFIKQEDKLLLCVSGGRDSMVLLHLMFDLGYHIMVAHVNYHLRLDSDRDEALVKAWCESNRIVCAVKSIEPGDLVPGNLQENARRIRYQFFLEIAAKESCKWIITAHHSADLVETFLMNLSRGSGIVGLKSIPALQGNILRPLLSCDPKLIETYAQNHGILYNHDESNLKSEYLRNFFRNTIIPAIEDRLPHFSMNVVKSVCLIQDASEILDDQYDQWRKINVSDEGKEVFKLSRYDHRYFLSRYFLEIGFGYEQINLILDKNTHTGAQFTAVKNDKLIRIDRDWIWIFLDLNSEFNQTETFKLEAQKLKFANWNLEIEIFPKEHLKQYTSKFQTNMLYGDMAKISERLVLRQWESGDRMKPFGMTIGTKKLQDIFSNKKLAQHEKMNAVILQDSEKIVAVIPHLISEEVRVDERTEMIFSVRFWKERK